MGGSSGIGVVLMTAASLLLLAVVVFAGAAGLRSANAQGAATGVVIINEIELNPKGQDAGNEWIELYNPTGADVNIGDYKVITTFRSVTIPIPAGAVVGAGQFYVLAVQGQVLANADSLTLADTSGQVVIDRTPSLVDRSDDSRTWQRVPDGGSQWKFMEGTKNRPNEPATYKGKQAGSEVAATPSAQSTNASGQCAGAAMCIEGKVVRVADADTVYVQKGSEIYKVDLSLTKATGKSDRTVTQALCLGNNALVDQDDKQPGKGKTIMGVVYCNSQNLNQQLLDAGIVGADSRQCATSEFAGQDWARKHC